MGQASWSWLLSFHLFWRSQKVIPTPNGPRPMMILPAKPGPLVDEDRKCLSVQHDLSEVIKQARSLIGLGEGLTPSGDDFMGGLFFARHLLSCLYPDLFYLKSNQLSDWVEAIKPRTNLISFILLKDNANGHALDPLNRFGMALLTEGSQEITFSASLRSDQSRSFHRLEYADRFSGWNVAGQTESKIRSIVPDLDPK